MKKPGYRYLIIGGSVYALELVVIVVAQHYFGTSAVLAVGISFWAGLIVSFFLQKMVTFGDKRMKQKVLLQQIMAFALLVLFNFGFTLLVAKLLGDYVPAIVSRTIALCITTFWNYYLYKTHIFKTNPIVTNT